MEDISILEYPTVPPSDLIRARIVTHHIFVPTCPQLSHLAPIAKDITIFGQAAKSLRRTLHACLPIPRSITG
jgi:hypothetical protein